jgi:hypothetical protein
MTQLKGDTCAGSSKEPPTCGGFSNPLWESWEQIKLCERAPPTKYLRRRIDFVTHFIGLGFRVYFYTKYVRLDFTDYTRPPS